MEYFLELLKSIPAPAWSAFATAIITSGIAYLGVSYTNKENSKRMAAQHEHERQLRKDEVVREKAEELYVSVKKFCNAMVCNHFVYVRVMSGEISYNDALDLELSSENTQGYDAQRIHMITDIYFPKLSSHMEALVSKNIEVLDIREKFKQKYNRGIQSDEKMAALYSHNIQTLSEAASKFEKTVLNEIRNV